MLVLFLSNKYVRAVLGKVNEGRIEVEGLYDAVDTRECILNGTVTDEEAFLEMIGEFWEKHSLPKTEIHLVVGGNQFTTRVTDVPVQKPAQMMEYVSREFSDVDRIADPVYSYFALPEPKEASRKMRRVFAMAVPRAYVQKFQELFARLNITISGMESAMGVLLRTIGMMTQLKDATAIVQVVDDINIINILLREGEYVYSGRNRLYADASTPAYPVEVARGVSNMLQFATAQHFTKKILTVYVTGLSREDMPIYQDSVSMIEPSLNVEELNIRKDISISLENSLKLRTPGMVLAVGALQSTDPKTNVIRQIARDPQREKALRKKIRILVPIGVLAVVMLGLSIGLAAKYFSLRRQLREVQEYNSNYAVIETSGRYNQISAQIAALTTLRESMEEVEKTVLAYPLVNSDTEQLLADCAGDLVNARISGYDSRTGVLGFDVEAEDVEKIHQFVTRLEEEETFARIDYTGYTQDAAGLWHVRVDGTMAGRQEEQEEEEHDTESN